MDTDKWIEAIEYATGIVLFISPTHSNFYILLGVAVVTLSFFGYLLATYVASSNEGVAKKLLAFILPATLGILLMAASHIFVEPELNDRQVALYATIGVGVVGFILTGLLISKRLLDASRGYVFIVLVVGLWAAISSVVLTKVGLDALEIGQENVGKGVDRFKE